MEKCLTIVILRKEKGERYRSEKEIVKEIESGKTDEVGIDRSEGRYIRRETEGETEDDR
jgi:hypothetical protein